MENARGKKNSTTSPYFEIPQTPGSRNIFRKLFQNTTSLKNSLSTSKDNFGNMTYINKSLRKAPTMHRKPESDYIEKLRKIIKKKSEKPVKVKRKVSGMECQLTDSVQSRSTTRGRNIINQLRKVPTLNLKNSFESIASNAAAVEPFIKRFQSKHTLNPKECKRHRLRLGKRPASLKKISRMTLETIDKVQLPPKKKVSKYRNLEITSDNFTLVHTKPTERSGGTSSNELVQETVQVIEVIDLDKLKKAKEKAKRLFSPMSDKKRLPNVTMMGISKFGQKSRQLSPKGTDEIFDLCKERVRRIRESILNADNLGFIEHYNVEKMMELQVKKYSIYKKSISFYDRGIDYKAIRAYRSKNLFDWKKECVYETFNRKEEAVPPLFGPSRQKFEEEELPKWLSVKLQCINDSQQGVKPPVADILGKSFIPSSLLELRLERYLGYNTNKTDFQSFPRLRNSMTTQFNMSPTAVHKTSPKARKSNLVRLLRIDEEEEFFASNFYRSKESEISSDSSEYVEDVPIRRKKNSTLLTGYLTDSFSLISTHFHAEKVKQTLGKHGRQNEINKLYFQFECREEGEVRKKQKRD